MSGGYGPSESGQSEGAWAALLSVLGQSVKSFPMSRPVTTGRGVAWALPVWSLGCMYLASASGKALLFCSPRL